MLTFFMAGGSQVVRPDGTRAVFGEACACGPSPEAFHAHWMPGTTFITAVCEPATFGALLGIDILDLGPAPLPLALVAPQLSTGRLAAALCGARHPGEAAERFSAWLLDLARRRDDAVRGAFQLGGALLFSSSPDIAAQYGLSVRQVERRHLAAYGLNLRDRRKMARYVTALGLLIRHARQHGMLTRIAAAAGYFDQAHMIRDFNAFMGMAPGTLAGAPGAPDDELRLLRYDGAESAIITR